MSAPETATTMNAADYIRHVIAAGGLWSAYRQGYLAALSARPSWTNPFHLVRPHVAASDWDRGYEDASRGRMQAE